MVGIEDPGSERVRGLKLNARDTSSVGFRRPTMTRPNLGQSVSSLCSPRLVGA